jgi:hypothetical protein
MEAIGFKAPAPSDTPTDKYVHLIGLLLESAAIDSDQARWLISLPKLENPTEALAIRLSPQFRISFDRAFRMIKEDLANLSEPDRARVKEKVTALIRSREKQKETSAAVAKETKPLFAPIFKKRISNSDKVKFNHRFTRANGETFLYGHHDDHPDRIFILDSRNDSIQLIPQVIYAGITSVETTAGEARMAYTDREGFLRLVDLNRSPVAVIKEWDLRKFDELKKAGINFERVAPRIFERPDGKVSITLFTTTALHKTQLFQLDIETGKVLPQGTLTGVGDKADWGPDGAFWVAQFTEDSLVLKNLNAGDNPVLTRRIPPGLDIDKAQFRLRIEKDGKAVLFREGDQGVDYWDLTENRYFYYPTNGMPYYTYNLGFIQALPDGRRYMLAGVAGSPFRLKVIPLDEPGKEPLNFEFPTEVIPRGELFNAQLLAVNGEPTLLLSVYGTNNGQTWGSAKLDRVWLLNLEKGTKLETDIKEARAHLFIAAIPMPDGRIEMILRSRSRDHVRYQIYGNIEVSED